jgi:hypothetical protein
MILTAITARDGRPGAIAVRKKPASGRVGGLLSVQVIHCLVENPLPVSD